MCTCYCKKCLAVLNKSCVLLSKLNKPTRYTQKYLLKMNKNVNIKKKKQNTFIVIYIALILI